MQIAQIGFIVYTEVYIDKSKLCEEEGVEKTQFSYIIHCKPVVIGAAIAIRGCYACLQVYFILIIR